MFQSLALCPVRTEFSSGRRAILSVEPGLIGRRLLAAGAALAFVAAVATVPRQSGFVAPAMEAGTPMILQADTPSALRDQAEAMRAQLLATPGVGAVIVSGLHQQRLAVEYAPARLAALGVTPADLAAGLPVDPLLSRPGHLALRADGALDSPQDVAGLAVRSGARVFRLGDLAVVSRARLEPPVSVLSIDGRPAVRVTVIPMR